uniref:Fibroin light chain n=1 Tax=Stenopsyche marmorata TaxID=177930 RepID=A0A0K2QJK5_9NEOP|nr:fibroin light chain [Stenopsyche marmorata]
MAILVFLSALLVFQAATACNVPGGLLQAAWGLIEDGEIEPFALVLRNDILSNSGSDGGLYALGATFTAVSELSWVRPASACAHANLINANVNLARHSLGRDALSAAIDGYAVVLAQAAENFRLLGQTCVLPSPWPTLDNCCGDYGRIYQFEESWDLANSASSVARCAARDLYTSFGARANNVGAAATSAATSPALAIFKGIEGELISLLKAATSKDCSRNLRTETGLLKAAIFRAADEAKNSLYCRCV